MAYSKEFVIGSRRIHVTGNSLARLGQHTDLLVSPDDNHLSHGGGVSKALWIGAGLELSSYVRAENPRLRLGDMYLTPAFQLPADHILHVITIDFDQPRELGIPNLTHLFKRMLFQASLHGTSLGLPLIGTGAAGLDTNEVVHSLIEAASVWLDLPTRLFELTISVPMSEHLGMVEAALVERFTDFVPLDRLIENAELLVPGFAVEHPMPWELAGTLQTTQPPSSVAILFDNLLNSSLAHVRKLVGNSPTNSLDKESRGEPPSANTEQAISESRLPYRPLVQQVEWLRQILDLLGEPMPDSMPPLLIEAALVRNAAVHGMNLPLDVDRYEPLVVATRELLKFLNQSRILHVSREQPELRSRELRVRSRVEHGEWAPRIIGGERSKERETLDSSANVSGTPGFTTAPVREFHRFMEQHLNKKRIEEIDTELINLGHQGAPELCRLEFWLVARDPVKALTEEFKHFELSKFLQQRTGKQPGAGSSSAEIAAQLVQNMGFTIPREPIGLENARRLVDSALNTILIGSPMEYRGVVTAAAQEFERICHMLLHFVCKVAFKSDVESFLQRHRQLNEGESVRRVTLGSLIKFLEFLQRQLEVSTEPSVLLFEKDFETRSIFPKPAETFVTLRNAFTHYQRTQRSEPQIFEQARDFLTEVKRLLTELDLAKPRVFPDVIVVDQLRFDRWGRRFVYARTSRGFDEIVFTDEAVEPGKAYLMHPLNNPVHVDPILVPAGDLA